MLIILLNKKVFTIETVKKGGTEMSIEAQVLENQKTTSNETIWQKAKINGELIAAIICGIFIFIGWLFDKNGTSTLSVLIYILAFVIGGFAKAKEGIIDTIENKELNVEMLMILA